MSCKYFRVHINVTTAPFGGRGAAARIRRAWCAHPKHSPVDEFEATTTLGGGQRLHCEGDPNDCPISDEQFKDTA